jgi:hypothetical protein
MKTIVRRTILFLGLIIAALVLANNFSYAHLDILGTASTLDQEIEQLTLDIIKAMDQEDKKDTVYKIFNKTDQLVYESRYRKDKKLVQFLNSCDFITEVNKISYYKLSR